MIESPPSSTEKQEGERQCWLYSLFFGAIMHEMIAPLLCLLLWLLVCSSHRAYACGTSGFWSLVGKLATGDQA